MQVIHLLYMDQIYSKTTVNCPLNKVFVTIMKNQAVAITLMSEKVDVSPAVHYREAGRMILFSYAGVIPLQLS